MAIPEYVPTDWVDDSIPALNAFNLNKIESGIKDVTKEVVDKIDTLPKASETVFGVIKMWKTGAAGDRTAHFQTT